MQCYLRCWQRLRFTMATGTRDMTNVKCRMTNGECSLYCLDVQGVRCMDFQILSQFGHPRVLIRALADGREPRRTQSMIERFEIVSPAMFVPLVEDVIDHIHSR